MKNDPVQRDRIQETKRKRREFIEKHAKKFKVDESAEEEQNDEQMDDIGSRGLKRKAEDNQETETMEVIDCMCESAIDVAFIVLLPTASGSCKCHTSNAMGKPRWQK